MPQVSVIMPCFNHGRFVRDSVDSILRQTHTDWELIIIDDCSADDAWETIQAFARCDRRIKAIKHAHNLGASKSRNDGLRIAEGDFIGFCDADDIWEPDKLRHQLELLRNNPGFDLVYCDAIIIDEEGQPTGRRFSQIFPPPRLPSGELFGKLMSRNFINMQSVLMRRECVRRVGYFDEKIKWIEDWWYWVQLSRHHRFLYSKEPLARYRVHSRSTNLVHKRGGSINRVKVFHRILRQYADLPWSAKSKVLYNLGSELCDLGKGRAGRRLLWNTVQLSVMDFRSLGTFCRALRQLMLRAPAFKSSRIPESREATRGLRA